jgi:MFS transporter, MHS family, proline/betaine transporter
LIGGITSFVLRGTLTHEQLVAWGWRIPFLAGISISYAAYYLKAHGSDDTKHGLHSTGRSDDVMTEYQAGDDPDDVVVHSAVPVTNPLREAFSRGNLRSLLAATLVPMLFASGFYFSFVWMAIYMSKLIEHPVPGAHALNAAALFLSVCLVFPVAGALSDRFGRVRVMTIGALGMGIFTPLLLQCIRQGEPGLAFIAQCTMGVLLSTYSAPMCAWLVEAFEPGARLTSVAIGYNFAQAIAGGSTPFVATYMVDNVGSSSPGWILTFVSMASLIGLRCVAPAAPKVMFDSLSLRGSKDDKFEMTDTVVPTPESNERVDDKPSAELL